MAALYEYRTTRRRVSEAVEARADTPELLVAALEPLFDGEENESVVVALLNRKMRVLGVERLYRGTVSSAPVRLAELFRLAVRENASAIALAHNHPSGDPTPSGDDLRTTRDAVAAGRLLGIDVTDHIIFGDRRWVSLRRMGEVR